MNSVWRILMHVGLNSWFFLAMAFGIPGDPPSLLAGDEAIKLFDNHHVSWSPDGKRMAFDSNQTGNSEIYIMNEDGQSRIQLTFNPAEDIAPVWSPDGRYLAFQSNREGMTDLYLLQIEDLKTRRLTASNIGGGWVGWSTDGKHLLVTKYGKDQINTALMIPVNGSTAPKQLLSPSLPARIPRMSPDGRWIALSVEIDGNEDLYLMPANSPNQLEATQLKRITFDAGWDGLPAWSPNSKQLAYISNRFGDWDLFMVHLDGRQEKRLTDHDLADSGPSWSPDGKNIAFESNRSGNREIYVLHLKENRIQRLTDAAKIRQ